MPEDLTPFEQMSGFVCWETGPRLTEVLSADAMTMGSENFLPTHVRRALRSVQKTNTNEYLGDIAATAFLHEFLSVDVSHFQGVIVGTSGRGKSRVIRWLALHTPPTSTRRVVLIDKSDLNLRRVIERILEGMEGQEFDTYRNQLSFAQVTGNVSNAPTLLLDALSLSVNMTSPHATEPDASGRRQALMERLPPLLSDPKFRQVFIESRPIIRALVEHAVGRDESSQREKPRAFVAEDFDVDSWDLNETDLNANARSLFKQLRSSLEIRTATADWVNRNLADALGKLINFSQTDLGQLFKAVRRALKAQGRELILLIEDFARLQGVDYALLDAINDVAGPENEVCRLRCVLAMTTGIYDVLPDTFKTRCDRVVSVDLPSEDAEDDRRSIAAFHLNVLRTKREEVAEWNCGSVAAAHTELDEGRELPSACNRCPHRPACHSAFGSYRTPAGEEIGYYPYTDRALREMYNRAGGDHGSTFSPRRLLSEVLRSTLQNHTSAIQERRWLPSSVVNQFGNRRMPPTRRQELQVELNRLGVSEDEKARYENLLEIYGDYTALKGVTADQFAAFGLRPLRALNKKEQNELEPAVLPATSPVAQPLLPRNITEAIEQVNRWGNKGSLDQTTVNTVRPSLFAHVKESISWDTFFIGETYHAGANRYFQSASLYFDGQIPARTTNTPLVVTVRRTQAAGIVAALKFEFYKSWEFDETGVLQQDFYTLIETLSSEVVQQLQRCSTDKWLDPAPLAAELLLLDALFSGAYHREMDDANGLRGEPLFFKLLAQDATPLGTMPSQFVADLRFRQLHQQLHQRRKDLRELLFARVACTKGSSTDDPSFIDAARIRYAVSEVASQWSLSPLARSSALPRYPAACGAYGDLFALRDQIVQYLPAVVDVEREKMRRQLLMLSEHFGDDTRAQNLKETLVALKVASEAASQAGVWRPAMPNARAEFTSTLEILERMPNKRLQEARDKASSDVLESTRAVPLLFHLGVQEVVTRTEQWAEKASAFLTATATQVQIDQSRISHPAAADTEHLVGISESLDAITSNLEKLCKIGDSTNYGNNDDDNA